MHEMDSEISTRLLAATGFDRDEGNLAKNEKHRVQNSEIEEIFFNPHQSLAEIYIEGGLKEDTPGKSR